MARAWITLPLVLGINTFVDFTDVRVLTAVRVGYVIVAALTWLAWSTAQSRIAAKKDERPIWVKSGGTPNIMNMIFGDANANAGAPVDPSAYTKSTVHDVEAQKASQGVQSAFMGTLINMFFSFQLGIQLPLALQLVQGPLALFDEPLIRMHVLGQTVEKPHGEALYTDPAARTTVPAAPVTDGTTSAPAGASRPVLPGADVESEEAVFQVWEAREELDVAMFEHLVSKGKDINYRTAKDGWTALMVVAGSTFMGGKATSKLLDLGAKPEIVDNDGWNAAHWAAFHGMRASVDAILTACQRGRCPVEEVFDTKNADGRTPAEVAAHAGHTDLAQHIRAALVKRDGKSE